MTIVKYIFSIIFITIYIILPNGSNGSGFAKADDSQCLLSILTQLYGLKSVSICGSVDYSNVYYKTTCNGNTIDTLEIESKDESITTLLDSSHLSCFTNVLTKLTLFRVKINSFNPFGYSVDTAVTKIIELKECIYSDGEFPLVASGKSLPIITERVSIIISQISNYNKLRFSTVKYAKEFYFYLVAGMKTNYAEFVNDLQDSQYEFKTWYIQTNNIPSFLNTKILKLYLHLQESISNTAMQSLGNLDSFNMVDDLQFIFDYQLNFPTQLSSTNNKIKVLTIEGVLKAVQYHTLPPTLERYQHTITSPEFNIDTSIPFSSFPDTLLSINVASIGIKIFPKNLPTTIENIQINNNQFIGELPDFTGYNSLTNVEFINGGFIGEINESYCNFKCNLQNNNLNGSLPKCKICYIEQFPNYFSGNPSLSLGTCEPGSVVPNILKYDSVSKLVSLTGVNLGLDGPIIYHSNHNNLQFQVLAKQSSFTFIWDQVGYGPIPDTLLVGIGKRNYTLPTKYLIPSIKYIGKSGNQFTFVGSNFSYNKAEIQVKIANVQGVITFIDFNSIVVGFQLFPLGEKVAGTITNTGGNLILGFVVNTLSDSKLCSNDCGESLGRGSCNTSVGECVCAQKWTGNSCSTPNQFLTSASSTFTNGGIVNLFGWFGTPNVNLTIKIGDLDCNIKMYNETFANCTIGAGSGTKSITITQNGKTYVAADIFHYNELTYKCPKDCSLNGVQNGECIKSTGECKCYTNWAGYDCNSRTDSSSTSSSGGSQTPKPTLPPIEIPKSNTTVNDTSGSTIISNQQTSYEISILSLVELDILDNVVLVHNLTNKWINNSTSTNNNNSNSNNNNIYKFTQSITESCSVVYTIEDVKEAREFTFAGLQLSLAKDTVKMTVTINNYPFKSALNKLQLRLESSVGDKQIDQKLNNQCNNRETEIDSSQIDKNQLLNYITISRNEKILYGRYLNRVLSDTRESFITTTLITNSTSSNKDSFIIGLNLPFFTQSLTIDPDFSVLVSSDYQGKCNSSDSASWVLPVAIVIPCVVVAAIIIIASILVKKNRTAALLLKRKLSLKSLSRKSQSDLYMPNDNNQSNK